MSQATKPNGIHDEHYKCSPERSLDVKWTWNYINILSSK